MNNKTSIFFKQAKYKLPNKSWALENNYKVLKQKIVQKNEIIQSLNNCNDKG